MSNLPVVLIIVLTIVQFAINVGLGIYAAIILANNSVDSVRLEIYAYVITMCIFHFVYSITSLCLFAKDENEKNYTSNFVGLGLFIWSCVILFGENGWNLRTTSPYFMFIFVEFFAIIAQDVFGIIISLGFCCKLFSINKENQEGPSMLSSIHINKI